MRSFFSRWGVSLDDRVLVNLAMQSGQCRDGAYGRLLSPLAGKVYGAVGDKDYTVRSRAFTYYCYRMRDRLRIVGESYHAEGSANNLALYGVPRTIEKLRNKYPNCEFMPATHTVNTLSGIQSYPGIIISGDMSAIGAWYWASLIMRCAATDRNKTKSYTPEQPWTTVSGLLRRSDDNSALSRYSRPEHIQAWNSLRAGNEPAGWKLLATQCGPVSAHRMLGDYDPDNTLKHVESFSGDNLPSYYSIEI